MALVILTADVKNGKKWERAFRSHVDMFANAGLGTIRYAVDNKDHVVMCTDVEDVDAYLAFVKADSTREAMKGDGVKRKTVKVTVLDKELTG